MRTIAPFSAALLLLGLTGCPTNQVASLDPSAAYPDAGTGNIPREGDELGQLFVRSSEVRVDQEGRPYDLPHDLDCDSSHSVPTGYAVFDWKGRQVAQLPNHSPLVVSNEGPSDVYLPPGRYLVRLDRSDGRVRTFWVTIERKRRTEVDPAWLDPNPLLPPRPNPPAQ